jgi:hypothetical protein
MEPNTGVTFDDVAGVEEAKQDFMEVRARAACWTRRLLWCSDAGRVVLLRRCVVLPATWRSLCRVAAASVLAVAASLLLVVLLRLVVPVRAARPHQAPPMHPPSPFTHAHTRTHTHTHAHAHSHTHTHTHTHTPLTTPLAARRAAAPPPLLRRSWSS